MKSYKLHDSGQRQPFDSGAVRDSQEGKGRFDLITPFMLTRLARVYEKGARKYDARNWEKGMPFSRFLDSAMRHIIKYELGYTDEDHLAQAIWNLSCIVHFEELIDRGLADALLNDLPLYLRDKNEK